MTPGPDFLDHARRLAAEAARQWHRVKPGAVIDIDEVQSAGGVADARLARAGLAELDFLPDQNFGAALLMNPDRF